jgi:hypothetical protein
MCQKADVPACLVAGAGTDARSRPLTLVATSGVRRQQQLGLDCLVGGECLYASSSIGPYECWDMQGIQVSYAIAMRGITHQPPRCRSAGWPGTVHRHHSPFIHHSPSTHIPIHRPASATLPFCPDPFRSAVCLLSVCHASSTLPSLPANHRPRPNPAYLRISILALISSSFSPPTPPARTSKHIGTCGATPALTCR